MLKLINWFVPEERYSNNDEMAKRARTVVGVILALGASVPIYLVLFYRYGSWGAAIAEIVALVVGLAYLLGIRRYGLSPFFSQMGLLALLIVFLTLALFTGGHRSPALLWIQIVPLVALHITSRQSGFIWAGVTVATLAVIFGMGMGGIAFKQELTLSQDDMVRLFMLNGTLLFFFAFGLLAISNQHRAQKTIERNNKTSFIIRQAIDESSDAIVLFDPEGSHFYQNKIFGDLFDLDHAEDTNQERFVGLFVDRNSANAALNQTKEGSSWSGELEMLTKNGRRLHVLLRTNSVRGQSGERLALIALVTDISKLIAVEATLRESEQKYRLVAENTKDAIWLRDLQLNLLYISPSIEKIRGFTPEEIMHLPLDKNLTPESLEYVNELLLTELAAAMKNPNREMILETQNYCKDGSIIWAEDSIKFLTDENGRVVHIIGVTRDITQRKKTEENLKKARSELIANAHRAGMADIAADTLHNVGNLLNSVKTSAHASLVKLDGAPVPELRKANRYLQENFSLLSHSETSAANSAKLAQYYSFLENSFVVSHQEVKEELKRLSRKIDAITNVIASQQRFAGFSGLIETYSLERLILDVLEIELPTLTAMGIHVEKRFSPVPEISIQKTKLLHILVNLIKNAEEALSDNAKSNRQLIIELTQTATDLLIVIGDNGMGIAEAHRHKIFAHGFTTKTNGYGFGLHSCALYMDDMNGKIWMESPGPGQGATFFLSLPLNS